MFEFSIKKNIRNSGKCRNLGDPHFRALVPGIETCFLALARNNKIICLLNWFLSVETHLDPNGTRLTNAQARFKSL